MHETKKAGKMPEKLKKRIELDFGSIIEFKKSLYKQVLPSLDQVGAGYQ